MSCFGNTDARKEGRENKARSISSSFQLGSEVPTVPARPGTSSYFPTELEGRIAMQTPVASASLPTHHSDREPHCQDRDQYGTTGRAVPFHLTRLAQIGHERKDVKLIFSEREGVTGLPRSFIGDPAFVQLPCDPNDRKLRGEKGESYARNEKTEKPVPRWKEIIKRELKELRAKIVNAPVHDLGDLLKRSVFKYNSKVRNSSFNNLNGWDILKKLLPFMIDQALKIEKLFPDGIPVLRKNKPSTLVFTQEQVCCILANAFLCTFRRREFEDREKKRGNEPDLPTINFNDLFGNPNSAHKKQKLKCIMEYFKIMKERTAEAQGQRTPGSILSFERRVLQQGQSKFSISTLLAHVEVIKGENVEDDKESLQVDFANSYVGGGVIRSGCVMEEIRFSICPELIAARLFTEKLEDEEVLVVTGCERFSNYRGYGDSFRFTGGFKDETPLDDFGRRNVQVVAMDALHFQQSNRDDQYKEKNMMRELKKGYCAFMKEEGEDIWKNGRNFQSVATGHWGCGAFNGDWELKFILQWIAASEAGRPLRYHIPFDDWRIKDALERMVKFAENRLRIGDIWKALQLYNEECGRSWSWKTRGRPSLFDFLNHCLGKGI